MTTQSGEGGEKTASPKPTETIHLTSDHDNIGETENWCGEESLKTTESFAQTTCIGCLKTVKIYAEGAALRLQQLEASPAKLFVESAFTYLNTISGADICSDRSCIRCRIADAAFEVERTFTSRTGGAR